MYEWRVFTISDIRLIPIVHQFRIRVDTMLHEVYGIWSAQLGLDTKDVSLLMDNKFLDPMKEVGENKIYDGCVLYAFVGKLILVP